MEGEDIYEVTDTMIADMVKEKTHESVSVNLANMTKPQKEKEEESDSSDSSSSSSSDESPRYPERTDLISEEEVR